MQIKYQTHRENVEEERQIRIRGEEKREAIMREKAKRIKERERQQ